MNELSLFDSLFNEVFSNTPKSVYGVGMTPRVDVKEEDNSYVLEMELPGCCEKDVNIELDRRNLKISSVKDEEKKENVKHKYILKERRVSSFERNFTLPSDVDSDSITANFKNGILTVTMQKREVEKPKRIEIAAS